MVATNGTGVSDPLGMPEDALMSPAEFRVTREFLGLSGPWLAAHLGVTARTGRHWEQGKYPIPDGARLEIERIEAETGKFVRFCADQIKDVPEPNMVTYRSDEEFHAAYPDLAYPASWHRAVVARVAQEVSGLVIRYANDGGSDHQ